MTKNSSGLWGRDKYRERKDLYQLEVGRIALALSRDLRTAYSFWASYKSVSRNPALADQVRKKQEPIHHIRVALFQEVILALSRIWEVGPATASIIVLRHTLKRKLVQIELGKIRENGFDIAAYRKWASDIDTFAKSDAVQAIQRFRNEHVAHTMSPNDISESVARAIQLSDARRVMDTTADLLRGLQSMIGQDHVDYKGGYIRMARTAAAFWKKFVA